MGPSGGLEPHEQGRRDDCTDSDDGQDADHRAEQALCVGSPTVLVAIHVTNQLRDEDGVDGSADQEDVHDGRQCVGDRVRVREDAASDRSEER